MNSLLSAMKPTPRVADKREAKRRLAHCLEDAQETAFASLRHETNAACCRQA